MRSRPPEPGTPLPIPFMAGPRSIHVVRHAGAIPNGIPVSTLIPNVNARRALEACAFPQTARGREVRGSALAPEIAFTPIPIKIDHRELMALWQQSCKVIRITRTKMIKRMLSMWAVVGLASTTVFAMNREVKVKDRLDASEDTLIDMMHASDHGIPHSLLVRARCVIIVPGMKKAGFVVGAKYGRGFVACRNPGGGLDCARRDPRRRWEFRTPDWRIGDGYSVARNERARYEAPPFRQVHDRR